MLAKRRHGTLNAGVLALALTLLLAPLSRAGETPHSASLAWRARGAAATTKRPSLLVRAPSAEAAKPLATRAVLRWTPSRMSYQPPGAAGRGAIQRVSGQEEIEPSDGDPPSSSDADAHKNPFEVASQPADGQTEPAPVHELPLPEKTATDVDPAGELPIPDATPPAADALDELPIPDDPPTSAETASQQPDPTGPPDAPSPLTPDRNSLDELVPDLPERDFEPPPGDLSEGISTGPGKPGCAGYDKECREALRELQERDITSVVVGVIIEGVEGTDYPCDCKIGRDFDVPEYTPRNFSPTLFTWKASGLCHKPLYFEDVQLERYGHSWNPIAQPFISGAHFFVSVPLLPYKMGLKPPHECVYSLGYYRPGSCAPYMFEPIPLSLRAALFEAAGATAFAFWFWPPN